MNLQSMKGIPFCAFFLLTPSDNLGYVSKKMWINEKCELHDCMYKLYIRQRGHCSLLRAVLGWKKTRLSPYTTLMLSMAYAADQREISLLLRRFLRGTFDNMTKLTEWIVFAGLAFSVWITLLTDILPLKVSYKAKEVIWPVRSEDVLQKLYVMKRSFATIGLSSRRNYLSLRIFSYL